jgi:hypothetical protein
MMSSKRPCRFGEALRQVASYAIVACNACTGSSQAQVASAAPESIDSTLFKLVVVQLLANPAEPELRIDPRPLRNDPRLASLRGIHNVIPEEVPAPADADPLASIDPSAMRHRRDVLTRLKIRETDGLLEVSCPGVTIPPSDSVDWWRSRKCPQTTHRTAMIALPRQGGALWPGNVNDSAKFTGRSVYSVRVIETVLSRQGSTERSLDYVFERIGPQSWQFLERRILLIVE